MKITRERNSQAIPFKNIKIGGVFCKTPHLENILMRIIGRNNGNDRFNCLDIESGCFGGYLEPDDFVYKLDATLRVSLC